MITYRCSGCSKTLRVDDSLTGKMGRCPACREKTLIPAPSAEAVTMPPVTSAASDETATMPPKPSGGAEAETMPPKNGAAETATLPPTTPASALTLPPTAPTAAPRDDRAPPGYEILGELGRGGMGVVYRARQVALGRVVALKMILSGAHAAEAEMRRFQTEAEAIARLQHPGIVAVHEIGEHEGRPFFSLEFCSGGSLEKKLAGTPMQPKDAARLVRTLAEAVQAAHDARVIHRDLKPANVLLMADGSPKVTDFGLAKKLDEQGQTQTGSVMGTPSYMAPEQAEGKKDVGPPADVYALGAILYECLTGRPPFKAATAFDTILQVVGSEPAPLRQLNSRVPADLETVCLKCLSKEPQKRYGSAREFAEDLGRFVAGEPVRARRVGPLGRAAKWVRRNPTLAAMGALVFVAMAAGTTVSTLFALDASTKAGQLEKQAEELKQERNAARENEQKAKGSERETEKALDRLQLTMARSLLRPLAVQGGDKPMTESEWEALWELASNRQGRLGVRFVEEATRGPVTARQLRDRADLALHAALGLDTKARDEVEAILLVRMEDGAQRADLARVVAKMDGGSSEGARRTARQLAAAMKDAKDPKALSSLAEGLLAVAARMEPGEAAQALTAAMKDAKSPIALRSLARGLSALAFRMETGDASAACAQAAQTLMAALKVAKDADYLLSLAEGLSALASHMEPGEAATVRAHAAQALTAAMKDTKNGPGLAPLAHGLSALASRMEPGDASAACAQAAQTLTAAMKDAKNASTLSYLAPGLPPLASRMVPKDAAQAARGLTAVMKDAKDPSTLSYLARGLSALASRMEPGDVVQVAQALTAVIKDANNPFALRSLARELSALAVRMEPRDASAACAQAAQTLMVVSKDAKGPRDMQDLEQGLSALASRMEPRDAAQAAQALTGAIKDAKDPTALYHQADGLSALASRMEPEDASAVCAQAAQTLTAAMKSAKDHYVLSYLAVRVAALASRIEPGDASVVCGKAAKTLTTAMKDPKPPYALRSLAEGLSALASHMEPGEAATVRAHAAQALTAAMKDFKNAPNLAPLAEGLSALASHMEPGEAATVRAHAAQALTAAMKFARNPDALRSLAEGLSALASHMEPGEAATVRAHAAQALTAAMKDTKHGPNLAPLAHGLSVLASRMEPRDASAACAQAAQTLTAAMKGAKDHSDTYPLAQGLSALASRMETKDAAAVATLLMTLTAKSDRDRSSYLKLLATPHLVGPLPNLVGPLASPHASAAAALVGCEHTLTRLSFAVATQPVDCRFSDQQLVDLLKMPTCITEVRRVILARLEERHQRRFADQFDFVRFATEQKLGLDFLSPPVRDLTPFDRPRGRSAAPSLP